MEWWKDCVFYEIYVPTFSDGNKDGIGDFIGITSKLDYLKNLGVDGIWLTPFYLSPKVDNGYDVSDYYKIDPDYGTMEDFDRFLKKAKELNLKVIIDIILNHTSFKHKWFIESRSNKENPKRNFYIWKDGKNSNEPNNWESFFSGSAWKFDEKTKQYYYHAFSEEQVDLNWANDEVKNEMFKMLKFWLNKGIDGFRLDVINFLKTSGNFNDNPFDESGKQIHLNDQDTENIYKIIEEIIDLTNCYEDKFLVGEVGSEDIKKIKSYVGEGLLNTTFNFNLGSLKSFSIEEFYTQLKNLIEYYNEDFCLPTLFFSSHDMKRFYERFCFNEKQSKLIAILMLTFRGIPFIYYGDEIFLKNQKIEKFEDIKDIQGILEYKHLIKNGYSNEKALEKAILKCRDASRGKIPWNTFDYINNNFYDFYKNIINIRKENKALSFGKIFNLNIFNNIISYDRQFEDSIIKIYLNFSESKHKININNGIVLYGDVNGFLYSYESIIIKLS